MRLTSTVHCQSSTVVWFPGRGFRVDDIRFSNSMTTERNSLAPGVTDSAARTWVRHSPHWRITRLTTPLTNLSRKTPDHQVFRMEQI